MQVSPDPFHDIIFMKLPWLPLKIPTQHQHSQISHVKKTVIQWNLYNMDALGPTISVQIIKAKLPGQPTYVLKDYFGTLTECVDYAGVLIFKCPH